MVRYASSGKNVLLPVSIYKLIKIQASNFVFVKFIIIAMKSSKDLEIVDLFLLLEHLNYRQLKMNSL